MARARDAFVHTLDAMLLVCVAGVVALLACDNGKTGCLDGLVDAAVPSVCDGVAHCKAYDLSIACNGIACVVAVAPVAYAKCIVVRYGASCMAGYACCLDVCCVAVGVGLF